jgi:beta-mannosidase
MNEADVKGVGEADWAFKTTFQVTEEQLKDDHADLVFEGLDTFCDITLVCPLAEIWLMVERQECWLIS